MTLMISFRVLWIFCIFRWVINVSCTTKVNILHTSSVYSTYFITYTTTLFRVVEVKSVIQIYKTIDFDVGVFSSFILFRHSCPNGHPPSFSVITISRCSCYVFSKNASTIHGTNKLSVLSAIHRSVNIWCIIAEKKQQKLNSLLVNCTM